MVFCFSFSFSLPVMVLFVYIVCTLQCLFLGAFFIIIFALFAYQKKYFSLLLKMKRGDFLAQYEPLSSG